MFHIPIFMIVLGMAEGGFLLLQLPAALAVDVRRLSGSIALRCGIRQLFHSTAKAHSAAHKIIAVIEIHAQRQIFFFAACVILESR